MKNENFITVSARMSPRTRRLAETAAGLRGSTLSAFIAQAVEHTARRELMRDPTEPGLETVASEHEDDA